MQDNRESEYQDLLSQKGGKGRKCTKESPSEITLIYLTGQAFHYPTGQAHGAGKKMAKKVLYLTQDKL